MVLAKNALINKLYATCKVPKTLQKTKLATSLWSDANSSHLGLALKLSHSSFTPILKCSTLQKKINKIL